MHSIQEIFAGRFRHCSLAVVQRCDEKKSNRQGLTSGYTEHWPSLSAGTDLMVLAMGDSNRREIWCGLLVDQVPSLIHPKLYRFVVDRFEHVGTHDLTLISDADFYSNKGGGGARVIAQNRAALHGKLLLSKGSIVGENERREVWVRKNHHLFSDPVYRYWEGKCAVLGHRCNGLLIASHIKPWRISDPPEKIDPNNGLLLSVALDKLFDVGLIGFSADGAIILSKILEKQTLKALGVSLSMTLPSVKLSKPMKSYLHWHRKYFAL